MSLVSAVAFSFLTGVFDAMGALFTPVACHLSAGKSPTLQQFLQTCFESPQMLFENPYGLSFI